jgi:prepilin-type processing-associated H-X9-DG protein
MELCYRKPGAAFAISARGVIAIRKVWEKHDGQISLLFCDGHGEGVSSGDRFAKRVKTLCADGVYAST